jgi:quercetin dioxygenase-like cupin family protein
MTGFTVDPATLALKTTGLVPKGGSHLRQVLLDEIETRFPRDPESRINIQLSELNPGKAASWHIHNGVVYFVLLRGNITLSTRERPSTTRRVTCTQSRSGWCIGP